MSAKIILKYTYILGMVFCITLSAGHACLALEDGPDLGNIKTLDLITAQKIALKGNPSLAAAGERFRQAQERVRQAGSAYWPRLDASGSGSRVLLSENDYQSSLANARRANPFATIDDTETYYRAGLTASWTLFNGFERKFSNMSAQYGEQQSKEAVKDARRMLLTSVASGYYNAQLARENIAISKANMSFNQRQLKEAEARYRVGTGSLSNVLNFKVQINSAETELIKAEQNYTLAKTGLAALMGIPDAAFTSEMELVRLAALSPGEYTLPDTAMALEYAMNNRPDIQQMENLLKQAESNVGTARSGFYPSINLTASLDGDRTETLGFEREDFGKTVAVGLNYNLFAGGYNKAKVNEARAKLHEVERSLANKKISVKSEVVSAVIDLKSALDQLDLQISNAELVKRNRDLVEKEYAAGQGSLVRLNEAQRNLITAQSRLASADVSVRLAWEVLRASTGEILGEFD